MRKLLLVIVLAIPLFVRAQSPANTISKTRAEGNAFATALHGQAKLIDSLIDLAVYRAEHIKVENNNNRDSLFNLLPATKSQRERIRIIYRIINYGKGTSKKGLMYHYKILNWAKNAHDDVCQAVILAELGYNFYMNGDMGQALQVGNKALKQALVTHNKQAIGIAYVNLGSSDRGADFRKHQFGALTYAKAANDHLIAGYAYISIAASYKALGRVDSARFYGLEGLKYVSTYNVRPAVAYIITELAQAQDNEKLKLKYYTAAERIVLADHDTVGALDVYRALADLYLGQKQTNMALVYARKAYQYSCNLSFNDRVAPAQQLSKLFTGINTDSAFKYTGIYYTMRDSAFNTAKIQAAQAFEFEMKQQQQEMAAQKAADENKRRSVVLLVIIGFLVVLAVVFWRNNAANKKLNALLKKQNDEIDAQKQRAESALINLQATQKQLIQSEKMASLGELTAGIAHEIQNPLNFVNNFSEVSIELLTELDEELDKGDVDEARAISADLKQNLQKINHHGKRADFIVKGMLQHSRANSGERQPTNINTLTDEFLKLAYHGLRAKDKDFNAELVTNFNEALPKANIVQQDIGRVLLNLFNNAFYAVNEMKKTAGPGYTPQVTVTTFAPPSGGWGVSVKDNGNGIPDAIKDKIMQPFFTTKPTGQGTGLGLSLSYDIVVKGHGGSLTVQSTEGSGSEFVMMIP